MRTAPLAAILVLVTAPTVWAAPGGRALDIVAGRDAAGVAAGVLDQLVNAGPPPVPSVVPTVDVEAMGPPETVTLPDFPAMPDLPDQASETARDVLVQLSTLGPPPVPAGMPSVDVLAMGPPDSVILPDVPELPGLPDQASETARDVLVQLASVGAPPVPVTRNDAPVPEPATLVLLGAGLFGLIRRRRR